jgi:hypothetical protein
MRAMLVLVRIGTVRRIAEIHWGMATACER